MCAPVVPPTVASGHFEIVTKYDCDCVASRRESRLAEVSQPSSAQESEAYSILPQGSLGVADSIPFIRPSPTVLGRSGRTRQILAICNGFDVE